MTAPLPKHRAREYETVFIVSPEIASDAVNPLATRLTDVIARLSGKVLKAENWGKRKLAYPVRKHAKGTYVYLRYLGYSDVVHELERTMRMLEPVIKYLTVKVEEDVDPETRPVKEEDISFVPLIEEEELAEGVVVGSEEYDAAGEFGDAEEFGDRPKSGRGRRDEELEPADDLELADASDLEQEPEPVRKVEKTPTDPDLEDE